MTLDVLREEIDEINRNLVALFGERLKVARRIARLKKERAIPLLDSAREELQQQKIKEWAMEEGLDPRIIQEIFTLFIEYSRKEMREEP